MRRFRWNITLVTAIAIFVSGCQTAQSTKTITSPSPQTIPSNTPLPTETSEPAITPSPLPPTRTPTSIPPTETPTPEAAATPEVQLVDFESVEYRKNTLTPVYLMDGDLELNPTESDELFVEAWMAWANSGPMRNYVLSVYGRVPSSIEQLQSIKFAGLPDGHLPIVINRGTSEEQWFPLLRDHKNTLVRQNIETYIESLDGGEKAYLLTNGVDTSYMGVIVFDQQRMATNEGGIQDELGGLIGGYKQNNSMAKYWGLAMDRSGRLVLYSGSTISEFDDERWFEFNKERGDDALADAVAATFGIMSAIKNLYQPNDRPLCNLPGALTRNQCGPEDMQASFTQAEFEATYGDISSPNLTMLPIRPSGAP